MSEVVGDEVETQVYNEVIEDSRVYKGWYLSTFLATLFN